ncbi:hypothetical protein ABZP36_032238, partial [Zizania latifolia]
PRPGASKAASQNHPSLVEWKGIGRNSLEEVASGWSRRNDHGEWRGVKDRWAVRRSGVMEAARHRSVRCREPTGL